MASVQFYKSSIAGKAEAKSKELAGVICFDLAGGEIWLDGVLVGQANDTSRVVTNVVLSQEEGHVNDLKVSYTSGEPSYITLPGADLSAVEARVSTLEDSVAELTDADLDSRIKAIEDEDLDTRVSALENADEVDVTDYLDEDIKVTGVSVGNLSDGMTLSEGMSILDVLKQMLKKELDVVATEPSLKITSPTAKSVEVGSSVSGTMGASYTDGSFNGEDGYSYTLAAGCSASDIVYKVNGSVVDGGEYDLIAGDSTITFDASVDYSANGNTPKTNFNNDSEINIPAGTATAAQVKISTYRPYFYGYKAESEVVSEFDSDVVRALTNSGKAASTLSWKLSFPEDTKQVIIASVKELKSVTDDGTMNLDITKAFAEVSVDVNDKSGANAKAYHVYSYTPDGLIGPDTYTVTFK